MAKPELGTKRVCPETGRKFYDLNKEPVISPYTGKIVPVEAPPVSRARPEPAAQAVDAEAQGAKKPGETTEGDIEEEVEMDETLDDAAFIEEQEEEDADVTDIIGSDIENEEEG